MSERDAFSAYLAKMAAVGFQPSSVLGQNFLLDPTLHRWIAEQAAPTAADTVVEIGVGLGFLTRELSARAAQVVGVEIDDRLYDIARGELAQCTNVQWVLGDALGGPGRSLRAEIGAAVVDAHARGAQCLVVANLPYSVSGPLLAEIAALPELPDRAVLLVQKEMAMRIAAPAGSADYGGLSAAVQALFSARVLRDVPPQVFRPRPKVMSSILRLERRLDAAPELATAEARRSFGMFVRQLFQQRRKVLRTTLPAAAAVIGRQAAARTALELQGRAEQLAPDTIVEWWRDCAPGGLLKPIPGSGELA
jgi:16S rRNA (adenine1518-N6/adenine1519-N6)-dimethyltransferase